MESIHTIDNTRKVSILNNTLSIGLTSLMSLLYIMDIFCFTPALVWPSIIIIVATVAMPCNSIRTKSRALMPLIGRSSPRRSLYRTASCCAA